MLQAASGKLFEKRDSLRINIKRGVIYTNINFYREEPLVTAIGSMCKLDSLGKPSKFLYELKEHMESSEPRAGVILSRSMSAYIDDFADVASFSLRAICTPSVHLADRLLNQHERASVQHPRTRVAKFYDESVFITNEDYEEFERFAKDLIELRRDTYLAVIQAIRTYVAAVHRLSDDLNLSYTLLVLTIESLAQKFDGYEPSWDNVESKKRESIDRVLADIDLGHAERVREAILETEHQRLGYRFKKFILAYLPSDYFSKQADHEKFPIGRREMNDALDNLYGTRSGYVHTLKPLTKEFLHFASYRESYEDFGKVLFTFQGLFRLVRAVIVEFVMRSEKVEHDPCSHDYDDPHLIRARLESSGEIYNPVGLVSNNSKEYFARLVVQLDKCLREYPEHKMHSLRHVVDAGFKLKPQMSQGDSVAFLAFSYLCASYQYQACGDLVFSESECKLLNSPSFISLVAQVLIESDTEWSVDDHKRILNEYYARRFKSSGIKVPPHVEACIGLSLAERYRADGKYEEALNQLQSVADEFPINKELRALLADFSHDHRIAWLDVVYPCYAKRKYIEEATLQCDGL